MELRNYLMILWRRRWYVCQSLVIIPLLTYLFMVLITPIYESKAMIILKATTLQQKFISNIPNEVGNFDNFSEESFLGTIEEIIKSEPVIGAVIERMKLCDNNGELIKTEKFISPGKFGLMSQQKGIDIELLTGTNAFELTSYGPSAPEAQRIGEQVIKSFKDVFSEMYKRDAGMAGEIIRSRIKDVKKRLEIAEEDVEKYRSEHELFDTTEQIDNLLSQISTLETTYNGTLQQQYENKQILKAIRNSSIGDKKKFKDIQVQVEDISVIESYKEELLNLEMDIARRLTELTEEHVEIQAMQKQKARLQSIIKNEMTKNLSSQLIDNANYYGKIANTYIDQEFNRIELMARGNILKSQLEEKRDLISKFPEKQRILGELMREADILSTAYTSLKADFETTKSALEAELVNAVVIQPPMRYKNESYNQYFPPAKKAVPLVMSVFMAGIFGVILAFFFEYWDNRIWSAEAVENNLGLNVIGRIPNQKKVNPIKGISNNEGLMNSVCDLLGRIQLAKGKKIEGVLSVLSYSNKEGRSLLAFWLARALADQSMHVMLVDANLRDPVLHEILDISNQVGLRDVLSGEADWDSIKEVNCNVHCLTAGADKMLNSQSLFASEKFERLLKDLKKSYDVVIVDTPAHEEGADALLISKHATDVLILIENGKVNEKDVQQMLSFAQDAQLCILGAVLNRTNSNHNRTMIC